MHLQISFTTDDARQGVSALILLGQRIQITPHADHRI